MTDIQRTASELARAIRLHRRMDGAVIEARRQDEAKGMTTCLMRGPSFGPSFAQALADAGMAANARKEALEAAFVTMEPETLADTIVCAVLAFSAFVLFEDGVDIQAAEFTAPASVMRADRDRAMQLMGAVVRGLEKHVQPTADIETLLEQYVNTQRQSWTAIEAEAERVANALWPANPNGTADAEPRAEAAE